MVARARARAAQHALALVGSCAAGLVACPPVSAADHLGGALTIGDSASPPTAATPYPSSITVSGEKEIFIQARVRVFGFNHAFPDDVDLLLVGPRGDSVVLLSDAGNGPETDESFTVSDAAGPLGEGSGIGGTFGPTNLDDGEEDEFPAPAPAGPRGSSLFALGEAGANGTWSLYAVDDSEEDAGSIGGWELRISSRDRISAGLFVTELSPPFGFPENHGTTSVFVERSGSAALRAASVAYATTPAFNDPTPGLDFIARSGRLEWAAGESGPKQIEIPILEDALDERQECVNAGVSDPIGDIRFNGTMSMLVCIDDNDPTPLPPLVLKLGGKRVQRPLRQRGVVLTATPNLPGTVVATGTFRVPGKAAAVVRFKRARRQVAAGKPARLKLGLSAAALRATRRAFRTRATLRANVRVTLTGVLGRTATTTRKLTLKR